MRPKKVYIIDNYDSFTYNLAHYLEEFCDEVKVVKNDALNFDEISTFSKIVISPGPGLPKNAGQLMDFLKIFHSSKSILGVCLGMQAIGEFFGAELENLQEVMHGVSTPIKLIGNEMLFNNIPEPIIVGRYHSWVVSNQQLPSALVITSEDECGKIMSLRHQKLDIRGVQFHPESIMTAHGKKMLQNWINF